MKYGRIFNFSAGPAMMPEPVLEEIKDEMLNYRGSGMSVMEMSHRSAVYQQIIDDAEKDLRELMGIPDNYKVLFIQGGATLQFSMIPMNLMKNKKAVYINAKRLCINRVKGMLDINECGFAARFLCGSYYVKGNGGFTGAFRPKNLDDASAGHAAYAKSAVQSYGAGGYSLYIKGGSLPKLHNRTFSVLFFKLFYRGIKSVFFAGICHLLFLL